MSSLAPLSLSVVIPVYKAADFISELIVRLEKALTATVTSFEVILIEDGSDDNTWALIEKYAAKHCFIKAIKLSRNFGQQSAIFAGLQYCNNSWIVVMDCDLQDQPEEIPRLLEKALSGYEIVYARREVRNDSFWKRMSSRFFYATYSYLTDIKQDSSISNFGIYSKKVIANVNKINGSDSAFTAIIRWTGFPSCSITINHGERIAGKSSYNFSKLLRLGFDIIISFSDKPLKLIVKLGFLISFLSFVAALITLFKYLTGHITVSGYTSIIISIWLMGGIIISILGFLGLYISRIFKETKKRPHFIVEKTVNINLAVNF
jgi:polyisoprenyl-phosphate glycosyltransferase